MECVGCGDSVRDGMILGGEVWGYCCADPGEPGPDELDGGRDRVAVRDRTGCVVVTDPHMALWISECS